MRDNWNDIVCFLSLGKNDILIEGQLHINFDKSLTRPRLSFLTFCAKPSLNSPIADNERLALRELPLTKHVLSFTSSSMLTLKRMHTKLTNATKVETDNFAGRSNL